MTVENLLKMRDIDFKTKCQRLKRDIKVLPYHVFGDRSQCTKINYDCRAGGSHNVQNLIPLLEEKKIVKNR